MYAVLWYRMHGCILVCVKLMYVCSACGHYGHACLLLLCEYASSMYVRVCELTKLGRNKFNLGC